jgi:cell division initiation protein
MNYTPNDLQNVSFKKNIMGYSEDQVNEVLDKVIEDYGEYIHENVELKDKIAVLNEGMQHYKRIEDSLQNT